MNEKDREEVKRMIRNHIRYSFSHQLSVGIILSLTVIIVAILWYQDIFYFAPLYENITSARWETKCDDKLVEKTFYELVCDTQPMIQTYINGEPSGGGGPVIRIGTYNETELLEFLDKNQKTCDDWNGKWNYNQYERAIPSEKVNCYRVLVREVD